MSVIIKNLYKKYDDLVVFEDFSIELPENEISVIIGPSGCGKTTLLNMISKLQPADKGYFENIDGKTISYLFQEPRLIEWKTVWQNIEFVLKNVFTQQQREKIVSDCVSLVGLKEFKDYYPRQLSGGMLQRVSIARAFAYPSEILIMDEPFKQLDLKIKKDILRSFLNLWNNDKRTVIFTTHDIEEALSLGNKIFILNGLPGKILEIVTISDMQKNRDINDEKILKIKNNLISLMQS
ncbi:MAG: ABC transporter ATP-binding protein [Actinomycetota bacterium]|nr:ABC transporter ATP-binding protein [Actinomycetota bacterium]